MLDHCSWCVISKDSLTTLWFVISLESLGRCWSFFPQNSVINHSIHHSIIPHRFLCVPIHLTLNLKGRSYQGSHQVVKGPRSSTGFGTDQRRPSFNRDTKPFLPKPTVTHQDQDKTRSEKNPSTRTCELKCFKCQGFGHYATDCRNRKVMIIRENGEVESEEKPKPEKELDPEEYEAAPVMGKPLVARRTLTTKSGMKRMSNGKTSCITVKYRHPIPRLDDMLDELHGSCIFTTRTICDGKKRRNSVAKEALRRNCEKTYSVANLSSQ